MSLSAQSLSAHMSLSTWYCHCLVQVPKVRFSVVNSTLSTDPEVIPHITFIGVRVCQKAMSEISVIMKNATRVSTMRIQTK
eukprot:1662789-Amphidinium_carterae.1